MPKHYPKDMIALATNPAAKLILLSDTQPTNVNDCANCGGLGLFNVFVATEGPFQEPAFPYNGTMEDHKISHWFNGWWWSGKSYNFTCPDCHGAGRFKTISVPEAAALGVPA